MSSYRINGAIGATTVRVTHDSMPETEQLRRLLREAKWRLGCTDCYGGELCEGCRELEKKIIAALDVAELTDEKGRPMTYWGGKVTKGK